MKRYYLQFLAPILALFVCFNGAAAQQNQPLLRSFVEPNISYDLAKSFSGKSHIRLNLDNEGRVISAELLKGNARLFVKIKDDLAKWRFEESSEARRSVVLEMETVYSYNETNTSPFEMEVKMIVSPYRMEVKITIPDTESRVPAGWKEGSLSCEIHREVLIKDKIEIGYGLMVFLYDYEAYQAEKPKSFPNANSSYLGGCVIEPDSPKYVETLYCQKCRDAEENWLKENVKERRN